MPIPADNHWQELHGYKVISRFPFQTVKDPRFGNRYILFDLSQFLQTRETTEIELKVVFRVTRYAAVPRGTKVAFQPAGKETELHTGPTQLVPLGGPIAEEAQKVAGSLENPLAQGQAIYAHLVDSMTYNKSGQGWGRGDALYACSARTGNCSDFHSLFLGETRSLGIASRFIMGVPIPPNQKTGEIGGYHCWAEFYVPNLGWVPVDASEASKNPIRKQELFGGLDPNRVEFTRGRDISLPQSKTEPLNFSIYPHMEIDGKRHKGLEYRFQFEEVTPGKSL